MNLTLFDALAIQEMKSLDAEELRKIGGGEVILNNPNAVGNNAAKFMEWVSGSWNNFVDGFREGYNEHRK